MRASVLIQSLPMKTTTSIPAYTLGLDLGDKRHALCALDAAGKIIEERKVPNTRTSLNRLAKRSCHKNRSAPGCVLPCRNCRLIRLRCCERTFSRTNLTVWLPLSWACL